MRDSAEQKLSEFEHAISDLQASLNAEISTREQITREFDDARAAFAQQTLTVSALKARDAEQTREMESLRAVNRDLEESERENDALRGKLEAANQELARADERFIQINQTIKV